MLIISCMQKLYFLLLISLMWGCSKKVAPPAKVNEIVVVVNGDGKMVATAESLPAERSGRLETFAKAPLAFTPNERKNLMYRYKMVPPRILYVPDELAQASSRGTYYIYRKKLWYWRAGDGFFYLDKNYYK